MLNLLLPLVAAAAPVATPAWLDREFMDDAKETASAMTEFINAACGPSSLDGIQIFAVQSGHAGPPHVHVYCRADHSRKAHYRVDLETFAKGQFGPVVQAALAEQGLRIGPFTFGVGDQPDGLFIIRQEPQSPR